MVEHLVALKRGLSPVVASGLWATLAACVLALVLLTSGNLLRAKAPSSQTSLRAIYWLLHFPGSAVAVMFYAAVGMTLTA
jgi:ABC-type phosphate/phosphonate transport system permease subunit